MSRQSDPDEVPALLTLVERAERMLLQPFRLNILNLAPRHRLRLRARNLIRKRLARLRRPEHELVVVDVHRRGEQPRRLGVGSRDQEHRGMQHVELETGGDEARYMR